MSEITKLYPQNLWENFQHLCDIPRPSKHEQKAIDFVKNFGQQLGLETIVDATGNVIIRKPATPGMENRKGIILQGHLDMVPQKNSGTIHDFEKDPITPYIDGEWVKAKGTTLGSDNGIGVAAALAVLQSKDLVHGPIEGLFTIDEETGMTGAFELKAGLLKGDILINMDSEDEGELYVGCAGGTNANIDFNYKAEATPAGHVAFKISLTGLKGGHSGVEINLGRGNANKLMNRLLKVASRLLGLRISSIDGGSLRNAIPRESFALVTIPENNKQKFIDLLKKEEQVYKAELSEVEPTLSLTAETVALPANVIDATTQSKLIDSIYACPNGVIRMSDSMKGLVETSNNLASVKTTESQIKLQCLLRSSVDSAKDDLAEAIASVFQLAGAEVIFDGSYPGWKPNLASPILKAMQEVYKNKYGHIPEIKAIHAGLECGILGGLYPNWDMISFGPTIRMPHSPDEKVHIESVGKFWDFLVETLKNVPQK
jgi:dipeptidase D